MTSYLNFAGSCGYYWSSSLDTSGSDHACNAYFDLNGVNWYTRSRCGGRSVRAVLKDNNISTPEIKVNKGIGVEISNYYGVAKILNITGNIVQEMSVKGSLQIPLPKGIYIVAINNYSQKVLVD